MNEIDRLNSDLAQHAVEVQQLQRERALLLNLTFYRLRDGKVEPVSAREYFGLESQ